MSLVRVLDRASVDLRRAAAGWTPLAAAADRFPGSDFFRNDTKYLENIEKKFKEPRNCYESVKTEYDAAFNSKR